YRLSELLKQGLNVPVPVEEQVVIIFAGSKGYVDEVPVSEVQRYEAEVREYFRANHADLLDTIRTTGKLPEGDGLEKALRAFTDSFDTGKGD
ncbi:MAG TPA: F0F1 ATP synthase subunit alpha, partial [Acidimicrobiales bacterium]